jgi:hypothetical protein
MRVVREHAARLVALVFLATVLGASGPAAGALPVDSFAPVGPSHDQVPPFIDAMDGIAANGTNWSQDPVQWPSAGNVVVRGSHWGEQEAAVRLRMEGKGGPTHNRSPLQAILIHDNSGSMSWNDPNSSRCAGERWFIDMMMAPEEVGTAYFESTANLTSPLTTDFQAAKSSVSCFASGSTFLGDALHYANDEMIPKKKTGFVWTFVVLIDGCAKGTWSPVAEINRSANEGVKVFFIGLFPDPNSSDKTLCEPDFMRWSQQTAGNYRWVRNDTEVLTAYRDIYHGFGIGGSDVAGKPPKTGAPMMRLKLNPDIEVVPGSFKCLSTGCVSALPTNPAVIVPNNKGLQLEWSAPIKEMRIKDVWQIEFRVRSYTVGPSIPVNEVARSFIEYDRYDGSPGGTDPLDQLSLKVDPDPLPLSAITGDVVSQRGSEPGASVVARNRTSGQASAVFTDSQGRYGFTDLAPGPYALSVTQSGCDPSEVKDVALPPGSSINVGFYLECAIPPPPPPPTFTLMGTVLDSRTGGAIEGAEVAISNSKGPVATLRTDLRGRYERVLDGGRYTIVCSSPDHYPRTESAESTWGGVVELDVDLDPRNGSASGTVWDSKAGGFLGGVLVRAFQEGKEVERARTDSYGDWYIRKLYPGAYDLAFELTGYRRVESKVSVESGKDTYVETAMEKLAAPPPPASSTAGAEWTLAFAAIGALVGSLAALLLMRRSKAKKEATLAAGARPRMAGMTRPPYPQGWAGPPARTGPMSAARVPLSGATAARASAAKRAARRAAARRAAAVARRLAR